MAKPLWEDTSFKIVRSKRDYVLIRKGNQFDYEHHSHFNQLRGAKLVVTLFHKNIRPKRRYFIESMRRVTTKKEFEGLRIKKKKQSYHNITGRGTR